MADERPRSTAMIERLVAFDTTSRNSNLEMIDFARDHLAEPGVESQLTHDDEGAKANLYATLGPGDRPTLLTGLLGPFRFVRAGWPFLTS